MRDAIRLACAVLAFGLVGCKTTERDRLVEERAGLVAAQGDIRGFMAGSAPVGSPWASHGDTAQFIDQMRRNEARIEEIDRELARH
jgi:hypothetical protein